MILAIVGTGAVVLIFGWIWLWLEKRWRQQDKDYADRMNLEYED